MGLALGPAFGRAELAVWGGWGARVRFARGDPSQGGALPAARPMLYGLPFRLSLWHRRRSPFACRNPVWCVRPGVGINILNTRSASPTTTLAQRMAPSTAPTSFNESMLNAHSGIYIITCCVILHSNADSDERSGVIYDTMVGEGGAP